MDQKKLELLIVAKNAAQAELDRLENQLAKVEGAGKKASVGFDIKAMKGPLAGLSGGITNSLLGPFAAFLDLGKMIPKIFLGPFGILIGVLVALQAKFDIIGKTINTVKIIFDSLISLDFATMGQKISDVWTGAAEKAKKAAEAAEAYKDIMEDLSSKEAELTGAKFAEMWRQADKYYNDQNELIDKTFANDSKKQWEARQLNAKVYKLAIADIAKLQNEAIQNRNKELADKAKKEKENQDKITKEFADALLKRQEYELDYGYQQLALKNQLRTQAKAAENTASAQDTLNRLAEYDREEQAKIVIAQRSKAKYQAILQEQYSFIGGIFDSLSGSFGNIFNQIINEGVTAVDALKNAFTQFGNYVLNMLGQLLAKFVFLTILKEIFTGATGGVGGAILGFADKGLGNLLPQFQTSENQVRQVPGAFNMPTLGILHGGELVGRPSSGSFGGGGTTIIVQGSIFDTDNTFERIRMGLTNHGRLTGAYVG